jgi:hypothetical protein
MVNEVLRSAMAQAGYTAETLSAKVDVDPKTVERWISTGRIPHRGHRFATALLLGKDPIYLWPATQNDTATISISQAELISLYPNRGSIAPSTWLSLVEHAHESVDVLAFAASFLHDALPDFDTQLERKAREGVQVRLLLGDPQSDAVRVRGGDEGIGELLKARCELTWRYFADLLQVPGVHARMHGSTLYNSIFRFDDTMLVNTHIFGLPASHSPVLHIQHVPGGRLFTNYMVGMDKTWDAARSVDLPAVS